MNGGEAKPAETRPRPLLPAEVPAWFFVSAGRVPSLPRRLVNILALASPINLLCYALIRRNTLRIIFRQWGKVAVSDD